MILYLIRHGIAEDRSPTGKDADRELTERGTLRTALVAKGLRKLDLEIGRIISSPYARARQTAGIISRVIGHQEEIIPDQRLVPHGQFEEVSDLLRENDEVESLMLVGHEPNLGIVISGICAHGALSVDVKKASVTALQILRLRPTVVGSLLWSIPPKVIEELSR